LHRLGFRLSLLWGLSFAAATLIVVLHPVGLSANLDRTSTLTIAGLNLVAVSVTFGVVGIQAQHFAETYTQAIVRTLSRRQRWPAILTFEAVGVLYAVILALAAPTLATGWAAALLLGIGLVESGLVLTELIVRFDSARLIQLVTVEVLDHMKRPGDVSGDLAISGAQPILDLLIRGAQKGDVEVVGSGMDAWLRLFSAYIESRGQLFYSDQYIDWQFARAQELIETYGRQSAGVVLPRLIEGTAHLGVAAAAHRQVFDEGINEGVYFATRCMQAAVATSRDAHLSPAAAQAIIGVTSIGEALLDANKVNTAGEAVRTLRSLAAALANEPYLAHWASTGLAQILLKLADQHSRSLMSGPHADEAADSIIAISQADRSRSLGPTHFLTAPMAERSLPRLVYSTARAASQERQSSHWRTWDRVCGKLADFTFTLPARQDLDWMVRSNAADCCGGVLLALISAPRRDPTLRLFSQLIPEFMELMRLPDANRLHLTELLGEVLLPAYYAARPESPDAYIDFIRQVAVEMADWPVPERRRFAPALRRVGAAALKRGDEELARAMAQASLPNTHIRSQAIRTRTDEFETPRFARFNMLNRPGVPEPTIGTDHLDPTAQERYLQLELETHPPTDRESEEEEESEYEGE